MKKRILSIILALSLVFSLAAVTGITANAYVDDTLTSGNFEYEVLDDGTVSIIKYNGSAKNVSIPNKIDGKAVTTIGNSAFYECTSLASITIPDSVRSIGYEAFDDTALYNDESNWQDGVLYIGKYLISGKLEKWNKYTYEYDVKTEVKGDYKIKDGTKAIAEEAFYDCDSLTSITIPDSVTSIGDWAFVGCDLLTGVKIPDSVTSIGEGAFDGCEALTSITIPEGVTKIGDGAFKYCTSLTSINVSVDNKNYSSQDGVLFNKEKTELIQYPIGKEDKEYTIPNSVTSIGDSAFYSCDSLTSVKIPDSVTSIGDYAFCNCASLTSVTIPDSVTSIGDSAFYSCNSLTSVTIGNGVTSIVSLAFADCDSLTSVIIPNSVTSIDFSAFANCDSLTSITIPDSVTSIGDTAFIDCDSLTSVTIGNGVTSIGECAFGYYCDEEKEEYMKKDNFHINCYAGTAGEKYAIDNGFDYTLLDSIDVNPGDYGDANGDGKITANDVLLIRKSIAGQGVSLNNSAADVNADGKITATDVLMIRKSIAGQNVHFGK